ncbi:MAG TPA: hypothetical protein VMF69_18100 [Gemmataceae bacterium]|nr:hypothetical protein [Gemmataceae bacterium]
MSLQRISRRRLLGGLLTGLAAWLCPRSSRAAAPPLPPPANTPPTSPPVSFINYHYHSGINEVTVYTYDGSDRFYGLSDKSRDHPNSA